MSIEGLWTVRYASVAGEKVQRESGGVVVLRDGQVLGGDTWTYYTGTYKQAGEQLTLAIKVDVHNTENGESILGGPLQPFEISGVATIAKSGAQLHASMQIVGFENATIVALLVKVGDFPH